MTVSMRSQETMVWVNQMKNATLRGANQKACALQTQCSNTTKEGSIHGEVLMISQETRLITFALTNNSETPSNSAKQIEESKEIQKAANA